MTKFSFLVLVLAAVSVGFTACKTKTSEPKPSAAAAVQSSAASSQSPEVSALPAHLPNPYLNAEPRAPHHVAMQLPQPLLEPTQAQDPTQYVPANPAWPNSLTPVYGSELVNLVKASGKRGILINAWASWCGPCTVEMPMLVKLREKYLARGIDVWFVSVNQSAEAEQVLKVLNERKVAAPHYVAKGLIGYFIDALSPIWQGSLPATFLYDGNGKLHYFWGAHVFEEELTPLLEDFLAGKVIDGVANVQVRKGPEGPNGASGK